MRSTGTLRLIAAACALTVSGLPGNASAGAAATALPTRSLRPSLLVDQLQHVTGNQARVAVRPATGDVTFVGASRAHPLQASTGTGDPGQTARSFVNRYAGMFGITDARSQLTQSSIFRSESGDAVRYQQRVNGVPVFAGEIAVQIDPTGAVVSTSGEASPSPQVDLQASVAAETARTTAIALTARNDSVDASELTASTPQQWVYDPALVGAPDLGGPRLVWQTEVRTALGDVDRLVLVDAHDGTIALQFSQVEAAEQRSVCDNKNNGALPEACTSPVISGTGPGSGSGYSTASTQAKKAYDYAGQTYQFYAGLGRDSLDGNGLPILSTVRYCPIQSLCPYNNAYWNGDQMVYGDGYASALDVVGHELTHGVTQYTSQLLYYADSGAINESMSDVMGEFIDQTNTPGGDPQWLIGEDLPGGAVRSMKDPTAFADPDSVTSALFVTSLSDNRGVHTNSGVDNKAAYLIAQTVTPSITFNGQTISGIGVPKAAKIYYQAETTLLGPGSDYNDLYNVLPQACTNLIGVIGITAQDCQQVSKAVLATGMNQHPTNPAAVRSAPVCDSGIVNATPFHDDASTNNGNWVGSTTGGGTPWEYFTDVSRSGGHSLHVDDNGGPAGTSTLTDQVPIAVPIGGRTYLTFDHSYSTDSAGSTLFDGGVVEYSTDNGATWTDLGPLIVDNGYDGLISGTTSGGIANPLANRSAFGSISPNFGTTRADLTSLAGQTVRVRFVFATDNYPSLSFPGWFIDDVSVYRCAQVAAAPPTPTAVAGDESAVVTWAAPATDGGSPISGYIVTPLVNGVAQPAIGVGPNQTTLQIGNLSNGTSYAFQVAAVNGVGTGPTTAPSNAVVPTKRDFIALVPARLLDSRSGYSTVDGQFNGIGVRQMGSITALTVAGRGGIAGDANAVALNVTVTEAQAPGYLTVYPCGTAPPTASNLNYTTGSTIPNAVIAKVGVNGQVCLFTQSPVQLVVDANGYFPNGSTLHALVPSRLLDSRPDGATVDGQLAGLGMRGPGSVTSIQVAGRAGVPADASAAVLNVTVTDAAGPGYATVFPCGGSPPTASNLNYTTGATIPNAVLTQIGAAGTICVYTQAAVQLVVDINGYFPASTGFVSFVPARLLDTRAGQTTVDGLLNGIGLRGAGGVTPVQITGRAGVPNDATSAVLNVTVTDAAAPGYATVYPCGGSPPLASNLNFATGSTIANEVNVAIGNGGTVCVYTQSATQIVVDVNGYFRN